LVGPQPLGGDLYGTVNAGHIGLLYGDTLSAFDSGGVLCSLVLVSGPNTILRQVGTGALFIQTQNGAANIWSIDPSGNVNNAGALTVGTSIAVGGAGAAITMTATSTGSTGPYILWGNGTWWGVYSNGMLTNQDAIYFNNNAATWLSMDSAGTLTSVGAIAAGQSISMPRNQSLIFGDANTSILGSASDANIHVNTWTGFYVYSQGYAHELCHVDSNGVTTSGNYFAQSVGGSYAFTTVNVAAAYGQGFANAWINASSADFKKNVAPIDNPLGILLNPALRGVQYDHDWELPDGIPNARKDPLFGTKHNIGFVADDWLPHVPEIVAVDENGKAEGMDYARVTALLWEALREYVTSTNGRLEALESARPQ